MTRSRRLALAAALGFIIPMSTATAADFDYQQGFVVWLNHMEVETTDKMRGATSVAIENTSPTKAVRAPSDSRNGTSLVDTTSASDLIGVAVNLAGLSGGSQSGDEPTSVSATVSGNALYAAALRVNPLDPTHYCSKAGRFWRRGSLTLGYEDDVDSEQASNSGSVRTVGFKALLWSERDACTENTDAILGALGIAAASFGKMSNDVRAHLWEISKNDAAVKDAEITTLATFRRKVRTDSAFFAQVMRAHGPAIESWLADTYLATARSKSGRSIRDSFVNLDTVVREQIAAFQGGHKVALDFITNQRTGSGTDSYDASLLWDWGIDGHLSVTGNAKFLYEDRKSKDDSIGGSATAAVLYTPILARDLWGPSPLRISLDAEAKWQSKQKDTYKGQLTIRIPMPFDQLQGLELPISLSIANRSELVSETEVRGMLGFSIDTSQLFGLLNPLATVGL